jgi:hypothetical protein
MNLLAFIVVFAASTSAQAQPKYTPKIIPKCAVKKLQDGSTGCVYTLKQVKELYRADSELNSLRVTDELRSQKIAFQASIITRTREQLVLLGDSLKRVEARNASLTKSLIETDRKYQLERVKPQWGSYVSWGINIALAAALGGYVIAHQATK